MMTTKSHELQAEASRRLAVGLDIPPELLDDIDSRGNCDSQRTIHRDAISKVTRKADDEQHTT